MKAVAGFVAVLALAACPLQGTKNLTLGGGSSPSSSSPSSSSPSSSSSSSSAGRDADAEREREAERHGQEGQSNLDKGNFLRSEFEALAGLTVAKATAQAKGRGHSGEVKVEEEERFVEGCKDGIVCRATDERGGQSGMGNGDVLLLYVNKKLAIAPPPD
jgi:hypothetical protein